MGTIDEHRIVAWRDGISHLAQQMGSNLRVGVSIDSGFKGKRATYDQIGPDDGPEEVTVRHMDTPLSEAEHFRRNIIPRDYVRAKMVDTEDIQKILNDPRGAISVSIASGFGRKQDDIIIVAALATAVTGEEGTTTAAFDTSGFQIVHGSAGMTIAKLRGARRRLEAAEEMEDGDMNRWYVAMAAEQRENLLSTTEATSADFNTIRALVNGQISTFLGFEFLKSQRLTKVTTTRSCLAWVKSGIKLGVQREAQADIGQRRDKNMNWQVLYKASYGATRMRETAVVEIQCTES